MVDVITKRNSENKSYLFWLVMISMVLFFALSPFYQALFNGGQVNFDPPIFFALTSIAFVLIAIALFIYQNWIPVRSRDFLAAFVWMIPLSYLISMTNMVSNFSGVREFQLHLMYCVFFLVGAYFAGNRLGLLILNGCLLGNGYLLTFHGFLNWFGNMHYRDAVLDNRMSGVFQYPNTYAAFLIGIFFGTLLLLNLSKKWYTVVPVTFMLVPIFLSMLLTLSRGGFLVFPIVLIVYLVLQPLRKQLLTLLYTAIVAGTSLVIFSYMSDIRLQLNGGFDVSVSIKGWGILFLSSILVALIIYGVERLVASIAIKEQRQQGNFSVTNLVIPTTLVVLGFVSMILLLGNNNFTESLPNGLKERVENINLQNSSIASRGAFVIDSIKILKEYPLFGAGGGAWANLYNKYKSFPYTSQQTHTLYLQYLLETGIVGLSLFLLFLGFIIFVFIRKFLFPERKKWDQNRLIYPMFCLTVLVHSSLDFDMSYVFLCSVVFLGLGTMVAAPTKTGINTSQGFIRKVRLGLPATYILIALYLFISGLNVLRANGHYYEAIYAVQHTQNYNEISQALDAATHLQPLDPRFGLFKISLLREMYAQTQNEEFAIEADELLTKFKKTEPYNRQLIEEQYVWYILKNQHEAALEWLEESLNKYPWDTSLYEKGIVLSFELGRVESDKKNEHWSNAIAYYERFKEQNRKIELLPEGQQLFHMKVTKQMALSLGQLFYLQNSPKETEAILKPLLSIDFTDPIHQFMLRWYLASLMKQGKEDPMLYDALIEQYSTEAAEIQAILELRT